MESRRSLLYVAAVPIIRKNRSIPVPPAQKLRSEHPLGKAVVRCYRETYQAPLQEAEQFQLLLGRGVSAVLAGRNVLAGNLELMEEQKISVPKSVRDAANSYLNDGCTIIFLAVGQELCGFLALSDTLRKDAAAVIDGVTKTGVTPSPADRRP